MNRRQPRPWSKKEKRVITEEGIQFLERQMVAGFCEGSAPQREEQDSDLWGVIMRIPSVKVDIQLARRVVILCVCVGALSA